jgi:nucleoside-triphosphatase THEP1
MQIAYTCAPGRGDTDMILFQLAQRVMQAGLIPCGTVQINTDQTEGGRCDMDVQVLPRGPVIRISQSLGKSARGCRLNPSALEKTVAMAEAELRGCADLLIVNKFGKHEAEGRGFRATIGEAMALGTPVLVGLNQLNREAFFDFIGDLGRELPPQLDCLMDWVLDPASTQRISSIAATNAATNTVPAA